MNNVLTMDTTTGKHIAEILVIVQRYDNPTVKIGFHPWTWRLPTYPAEGAREQYIEETPALMSVEEAKVKIIAYVTDGFKFFPVDWKEVPKLDEERFPMLWGLAQLVEKSLPIEFHRGFWTKDPYITDRITILVKEES